jgi:hypothetical protein
MDTTMFNLLMIKNYRQVMALFKLKGLVISMVGRPTTKLSFHILMENQDFITAKQK